MRIKGLAGLTVVSTLAFSMLCSATDTQALELHESLALAYENNPELKAAREAQKARDEGVPQAIAGFLPTLTYNFNRTHEGETVGDRDKEVVNPSTHTLRLTQSVFAGGEDFYSTKQAHARVLYGRQILKQVEQQILNEAVIAYMDVVRTREVLALSRSNERVLAEQLQATRDRFELGETTRTDVAQSESRLARAESDRINAEGDMVSAEAEFKRVFEVDAPNDMTMPKVDIALPDSFDALLARALENDPSLRSALYSKQVADYDINITRSVILPSVDVQAESRRSENLSTFAGGDRDNDSVALNVTVPLYQSGAEWSRIRQAKRTASEADFDYDDARNNTTNNATRSWQDLLTSKADIRATEANVKAARFALEGVKEEQQVGSRTTLDVLDAEQELFLAEVDLVTAKRNEVVAIYNVKAVIGELTAQDLALNVELYQPERYYDDVKYQFIGY